MLDFETHTKGWCKHMKRTTSNLPLLPLSFLKNVPSKNWFSYCKHILRYKICRNVWKLFWRKTLLQKINESLARAALLQCWAKSVKSFARSYPHNAIGTATTPPLTPPCSGSEMIYPDFSGDEGEGGVFLVASALKRFILEQNVITYIFHNIWL